MSFVDSCGTEPAAEDVRDPASQENETIAKEPVWFRAGVYKKKKPHAISRPDYLFDSDTTDEDADCPLSPSDTLLLYDLPTDEPCGPLLPSYVAQKITLPLSTPSPMRTLSLGKPINSRNCVLSEGMPQWDADIEYMEKEAEALLIKKIKKREVKKRGFNVMWESTGAPRSTVVCPLIVIGVDLLVCIIALTTYQHLMDERTSVFLYFFLGMCLPNALVLFAVFRPNPAVNTMALQGIVWPAVAFSTAIPILSPLFFFHLPLLGVLCIYLIASRPNVHTASCTFQIDRTIREAAKKEEKEFMLSMGKDNDEGEAKISARKERKPIKAKKKRF